MIKKDSSCAWSHWRVISNFCCETGKLDVYDTVYCIVHDETRKLINGIFDKETNIAVVKHIQKQEGGTDCGAFSIAIATSLLYKAQP